MARAVPWGERACDFCGFQLVMCFLETDSPLIRRTRYLIAAQLAMEMLLALISVSTYYDFGWLGLLAAVFAGSGAVVALSRGCGNERIGYTLLLVHNSLACLATGLQAALTVYLLATVELWCCRSASVSHSSIRVMLGVLLGIWLTALLVRVVVCSSAQRVRKLIPSHGVAPAPREPVIGQAVQVAVVVPPPAPGVAGATDAPPPAATSDGLVVGLPVRPPPAAQGPPA